MLLLSIFRKSLGSGRYSSSASNPINLKACALPWPRHWFFIADLPGSLIAPILQRFNPKDWRARIKNPCFSSTSICLQRKISSVTQRNKRSKFTHRCKLVCTRACIGSMPILRHPVEVKGQPLLSVVTFYVVWNSVLFFCLYTPSQLSTSSQGIPCLLHLSSCWRSTGVTSVCDPIQLYMVLGLQTQVLTLTRQVLDLINHLPSLQKIEDSDVNSPYSRGSPEKLCEKLILGIASYFQCTSF